MPTFWTSYFAKYAKLDKQKYLPISISRYKPKFITGELYEYTWFAPSAQLLNDIKSNKIDESEYRKQYEAYLDSLDWQSILRYLEQWSADTQKDLVFMCYEKPPQFCHRHILAEYMQTKFNIVINELAL